MKKAALINKIKQWCFRNKPEIPNVQVESLENLEVFIDSKMEHFAIELAHSHRLGKKHKKDVLKIRLNDSEETLKNTYQILTDTNALHNHITPAGEWLIDNFYLIEEQIEIIKVELSKEYEKNLPLLSSQKWQDCYPRVYDLSLQIIAHGDGYWDLENLNRVVSAYQSVTPLILAELWAIPLMIRLALIENLSVLCKKIALHNTNRKAADLWADKVLKVAAIDPENLVFIMADMARSNLPKTGDFIAQFTCRLQNTGIAFPLHWMRQQFSGGWRTLEELINADNVQQASDQVSISNSIGSLRRLKKVDWLEFVTTQSVVMQTLSQDPVVHFKDLDFSTRARYCRVIQNLAKASFLSEIEVAKTAISLAKTAKNNTLSENHKSSISIRKSHVGYYLIAEGLSELKTNLGIKSSLWQQCKLGMKRHALLLYSSLVIIIILALTSELLFKAAVINLPLILMILLGVVSIFSISQLALSLINWAVTIFIKADVLPSMDFSNGIPEHCRTVIVIPALLGNIAQVKALIERLEVHYLGNRDAHLHFVLLTDFTDAPQENMPEDADLLFLAQESIQKLNNRYPRDQEDIFFLLHRPRRFNPNEQVWMGYERKRGKLNDLNLLLRNNQNSQFSHSVGRIQMLEKAQYVITLDSDTALPRDTARELVAVMAHPLNRPCYDPIRQCVTAGYGILQPRIAESLSLTPSNIYQWLQGNESGLDPYTRMVSDVYQDLFHEGSFVGKGIYDIDLFQEILVNQFPENLILSHDLLEGCYLRAGFVSNILLYEKSPENYLEDVKRRTRWIRGDWQLLGWLFSGNRKVNALSGLSLWKLSDNFRRSLVPVALLILFLLGWFVLPATTFWLIAIPGIVFLPSLCITTYDFLQKPQDMTLVQHLKNTSQILGHRLMQILFYLACLPHEAFYSTTAIVRTGWRLLISHRHLLEWASSDQVDLRFKNSFFTWCMHMWMGPVIALLTVFLLFIIHKPIVYALPLVVLWAISPFIAYKISQPGKLTTEKLDQTQTWFLRKMARKTWEYFNTFITSETHWLPPDNYQEKPVEILCMRTSPTNMGLALLANLSAYDFGYIHGGQLLQRTQNTIQTMMNLEKYYGHFFNWYDIPTLKPLQPRYISSVDSGNLAAHLLTLRQGLLSLMNEPLLKINYVYGLEDTFQVLLETIPKPLPVEVQDFQQLLEAAGSAFKTWEGALESIAHMSLAAKKIILLWTDEDYRHIFSQKLSLQVDALQEELSIFKAISSTLKPEISLREIADLPSTAATSFVCERLDFIKTLVLKIYNLAQMDMGFLYDKNQHLFSIGFNLDKQTMDDSYYDLLSSEARVTNFLSIAQGQISKKSWFALSRLQVMSKGSDLVLLSWSGSMFEYLMPLLIMPSYPGSLLEKVYKSVVRRHIDYGKKRGVPWGISESGFNALDEDYNYQYKAFGVPEIGLQRNLAEDLVVAPYASVLALMVFPQAACINLQNLAEAGTAGRYGFYEALDFTKSRLLRNQKSALVRSFMVHHQAMSLLALSYCLHNKPMHDRFISDPMFKATLLLLQERVPKPVSSYYQIHQLSNETILPTSCTQILDNPNTDIPEIQLLSNGEYHVMLTAAGGGFSAWKNIALTRWREDSTCDNWGFFSYVRDLETGHFWSTTYQPTTGIANEFKTVFSEGHAEFSRSDVKINTNTEVVVSPEDNVELRRTRLYNDSSSPRILEFTSYAEVVLTEQMTDQGQPAFSNLFIETSCLPEQHTLLFTRRSSTNEANPLWMFHRLNISGDKIYPLSYETDRALFVGRGRTPKNPLAMIELGNLSNTTGSVLDPVMAIRCKITLQPDEMIILDLITGVCDNQDHCVSLVRKYHDRHSVNRIFALSWTHSQVVLHQLNISESEACLYRKLAGSIVYANQRYRADAEILAANRYGQEKLWPYSISGDLPILLLRIEDAKNIELVRQLIQAQAYWRQKGLFVDLIIINAENHSYRQDLQNKIQSLVNVAGVHEHAGSIYVRLLEQISQEDNVLFEAVARITLSDSDGSLEKQVRILHFKPRNTPLLKVSDVEPTHNIYKMKTPDNVLFFNGLGGFMPEGDEYLISFNQQNMTPAPWVNVLANANFGTLVSESGQSYTWVENSHEFRLTPWNNDPIEDSSGEALYVRDDETGKFWSPVALPCPGMGDYRTKHGFGYSVFEHTEYGIATELLMYVAQEAAVKFMVLKVQNKSRVNREISVFGYVEWVLGDLRTKNFMHITTDISQNSALFAHNYYNTAFGQRTAFFDASTPESGLKSRSFSGSRNEFLGRNGSRQQPAALTRTHLSGLVGAGLDPCGAIALSFDLIPGQVREIVFILGAGQNPQDADTLLKAYHGQEAAFQALQSTRQYWKKTLQTIQVHTPDLALNLLANGWLVYQTIASRLWGRTGYYQSSGAFGFRDQLQDVMALVHAQPQLVRAHLLLCASRQFVEGDVQHWWHPPEGRGVRTRCSDDYLWLPFAMCRYVFTTGDWSILNESVSFLQGRLLKIDEDSYYELPTISSEKDTLYQHGVRAILHGLQFGVHGLPLMGSGDWNDGMNLVGAKGLGESVWLGFFMYKVLQDFAVLAERFGDLAFKERCEKESIRLQKQIENHAWDGEWYLRAWFDDGTVLGSSQNTECRIDSIAQSWSVLSKAAQFDRASQSMFSLAQHLIDDEHDLIKLLAPAFDHSLPSPGYIQAYVPGIRENGGQYTHAATWVIMAYVAMGEKERAWELFNNINPIQHGDTKEKINLYKIEPYVIAGDVYGIAPHIGRGGWSWYTGSAGWMYRLMLESLLGIQLEEGNRLRLTPCLPKGWSGFCCEYCYGNTKYHITFETGSKYTESLLMDGITLEGNSIPLQDDGNLHQIVYRQGTI